MNNEELYEKFGVTSEYIEASAAEYEKPSWESMRFGQITVGRPKISDEPLKTLTVKVPASRVAAIQRAAKSKGVSRSDFLRQAIDHELMEA